jgi:hypothetical protein
MQSLVLEGAARICVLNGSIEINGFRQSSLDSSPLRLHVLSSVRGCSLLVLNGKAITNNSSSLLEIISKNVARIANCEARNDKLIDGVYAICD